MTFIDDLGNELTFDKKPKKIISLVPSISETLYDLNLEEYVVGVTKKCIHPAHFKHTKQIVGKPKEVDIELIKELKPDIIFCNKQDNSALSISNLQKIAPVYVTNITSIEDSKHMIKNMGLMLNRRTESDLIIRKIDLKLEDFNNFIANFNSKKVSYFIGYNPWIAVGNNTYINTMLALCKLDNIYQNLEEYPEINPKRIRHDGDPEVLLFSSEPFPFKDQHAFEISEYTNRSSAVFVEGEMFGWFGSRVLKAFDYFKAVRNRLNEGSSF